MSAREQGEMLLRKAAADEALVEKVPICIRPREFPGIILRQT